MENTTIETTLTHMENEVCVLQIECEIEVDYTVEFRLDETGPEYRAVGDYNITAFIFQEGDRKARIEPKPFEASEAYDYFDSILDHDLLREKLNEHIDDERR